MADTFTLEDLKGSPAPVTSGSFTLQDLQPQETPAAVTYKAAGEKIAAATPEPIKQAAFTIADLAKTGYQALPESVQQGAAKTGSFIIDALDYISRPFQAQAVALKETRQIARETPKPTDQEIFDKGFSATMMPPSFRPENVERVQQAALRGLKGQEKSGFLEALPEQFRIDNPIIASAIGFAGDVVLDKSATQAPFQALKETVIKPIAGAVSVPGMLKDNELYKAFALRSQNIDKADELWANFRYSRDKAVNEGVRDAKALNNQIKALSKQTGVDVNDLKAKIVNDIELGQIGDDVVGQLETNIVNKYKSLLEQQRAAGIEIGDLGETYIPHIRSKQLDDLLNTSITRGTGSRPTAKTTQALNREIEDTVANINAKSIYGDDYQMFRNDPAVIQGIYEYKAANAIAGKKILEDVKQLGLPADQAPKHWVTIPEVKDFRFPPEVQSRIVRIQKLATNDQTINDFLKVFDSATNWWKMWSLGARPSYHTKNAVGNLWNNYLAGVTNPKRYSDAAIIQYKLGKNDLTGNIYGKPLKEIYEEMANRGVIGEGQYGGDIGQMIETKLGISQPLSFKDIPSSLASAKQIASKTIGTENPILKAGFTAGSAIEDNARIALFLDQVKKGASYEQAGKTVQKYLFDYGALSPLEQTVAKRVMPFYTWSRKNIPLQLEALVMNPDKINKINLLKQNVEAGVPVPEASDVPAYVKEQMPLYINNPITGGATAIPLSGILPFADLNLLTNPFNTGNAPDSPFLKGKVSPSISAATGSMNPFIKAPVEYLMNYDLYRQKTIEEFKGQEVDFLGVKMPAKTAKLMSNLIMLNEIDRLNPGGVFGTRTEDPRTKQITATPSVFGVMRESRTDVPEAERGLQAGIGLRQIPIDPTQVSTRNWVTIKKDLEDAKKIIGSKAASERTDQQNQALKVLDDYLVQVETWDKQAREAKKKK